MGILSKDVYQLDRNRLPGGIRTRPQRGASYGGEQPEQGSDRKGQHAHHGNPGWLWSSGTGRYWVRDKARKISRLQISLLKYQLENKTRLVVHS